VAVEAARLHRRADAGRGDETVLVPDLPASTRSFSPAGPGAPAARGGVIVGSGTVLFDASDLVSSTTSRPPTRWTVCATVRVSADEVEVRPPEPEQLARRRPSVAATT
jgi:hypothetical protein